MRSWRGSSGPPSALRVRQQEAVQALKHSFSFGQAPRQPPGDCRPHRLAFSSRPAAGPRGGSRYRSGSGLSRRDSGGTRQVPRAPRGNLKNLLLSPGAGPKCAPGNPRAVLSGFLPEKKKKRKQNEPRRHVLLLCLEKGPGFRGQAGRRAIGVQIRSDRGEHGSENTAASPCHSKGLSSQRNFSHRPYVRQHHAGEDERRALPRGPHPGAPPGPGPRGSRHTSAPGKAPWPLRPGRLA